MHVDIKRPFQINNPMMHFKDLEQQERTIVKRYKEERVKAETKLKLRKKF